MAEKASGIYGESGRGCKRVARRGTSPKKKKEADREMGPGRKQSSTTKNAGEKEDSDL